MSDLEQDNDKVDHSEKQTASLRKVWIILAVLGFSVSLNVWGRTQGGAVEFSLKSTFGISFEKDVPEAIAALWGVVFLTIFCGLAGFVMFSHARRVVGGWSEKYPFRLFDLAPTDLIGKVSQVIAIILLTFLPIYILGHSWLTMLKHGVFCIEQKNGEWVRHGGDPTAFFTIPDVPANTASKSIRLTSNEYLNGNNCISLKMADYAAPLQSWVMAFLSLGTAALFLLSMFEVFRPNKATRKGASDN